MIDNGTGWMGRTRRAAALGMLLLAATLCADAGTDSSAKNVEASIPFANHGGIRDWRADGSKGMWIHAATGRWYYASFSSQCTELPYALGVQFVPEPSGVLSRWSSIRLEHHERCFFRTLQSSDAPPPKSEAAKPDAIPHAPAPSRLRVPVPSFPWSWRATC